MVLLSEDAQLWLNGFAVDVGLAVSSVGEMGEWWRGAAAVESGSSSCDAPTAVVSMVMVGARGRRGVAASWLVESAILANGWVNMESARIPDAGRGMRVPPLMVVRPLSPLLSFTQPSWGTAFVVMPADLP